MPRRGLEARRLPIPKKDLVEFDRLVVPARVEKTLRHLDQIGRALDPAFDPNASIRANAAALMRKGLGRGATRGAAFSTLLETRQLLEHLPGRVDRLLEMLAKNELRVRVDALDERELIGGLQRIANRIAVGLVLAALIVGAAILIQVPTDFRILGYPGLAMVLFLAAAAGGFSLVGSIFMSDRKPRER